MPPKSNATSSESKQEETFSTMTSAEQRFLRAIFQHMAHAPDTNWDQVASDANLKSAKVAKERFRQISKRHSWVSGGGKSGGKGRPSAAASPKPCKVTKSTKEGKASAAKKKVRVMPIVQASLSQALNHAALVWYRNCRLTCRCAQTKATKLKFESDTDEPEEIKLDSDEEKHGGAKSENEELFDEFNGDEI